MAARCHILTPDAQYLDDGEVERATAGPEFAFEIHRERSGDKIPNESFASCDALLIWHEVQIDAALVQKLNRCRIIVRAGVGFDHVDLEATGAAGIPVCNTPDYGTSEVADHAIAFLLTLCRGIVSYQNALLQDPVGGFAWGVAPLARRVRGMKFGVLGLGRIGTATALRAKGLGCQVLAYDPYVPRGQEIAVGVTRFDSLEEFLQACDVLSLHTPLTPETRGMIGKDAFALMQPHALLINTARGAVVDLEALYEALKEKRIAGAALDVFPQELPDPTQVLWRAFKEQPEWLQGRLLLSPHAAWYSTESQYDARRLSVETVVIYLKRGELRNCVNQPYLREPRPPVQ